MANSFIIPTPHSQKERLVILTQNLIVGQFFQNAFMLDKPCEISRDKQGHIYALYIDREFIDAYTLGINTNTKEIVPFHVGKLTFDLDIEHKGSEISLIGIHKAFMNKGLGTVLLQTFENHAITYGRNNISLCAMRNYVDMSKNPKTIYDIIQTMSAQDADDYILKNFYDSNQYLYTSMGYVKVGQGTADAVKMKKDNLQELSVSYGFVRPLSFKKSKKSFSVCQEFYNSIQQASISAPKNFFKVSYNSIQSENFSPFVFNPTVKDTQNFGKVALNIKANNNLYTDRIERIINASSTYDTKYSNIEKIANSIKTESKQSNAQMKNFQDFYEKCMYALNEISESEPEPGEEE